MGVLFSFLTSKLRDEQPASFLVMCIREHMVVVSPTKVGNLAAHMLSRVPCTNNSFTYTARACRKDSRASLNVSLACRASVVM